MLDQKKVAFEKWRTEEFGFSEGIYDVDDDGDYENLRVYSDFQAFVAGWVARGEIK